MAVLVATERILPADLPTERIFLPARLEEDVYLPVDPATLYSGKSTGGPQQGLQ
jgi:hypothetical protein